MDPFSQASLSPADYYHGGPSPQSSAGVSAGVGLELAPAQAPTMQQPGPGPRNYKSRKYRPCDFCRARQVACKIEVAPPCQLCQSHRRECTFIEQPKKKRRPTDNQNAAAAASSSQGSGSRTATGTPSSGSRVHIDPSPQLPMLAQTSDTSLAHHHHNLNTNYIPQFDERLFERQVNQEQHYLDLDHRHHQHHQQQHQHQHHLQHHQGLDHATSADFHLQHLGAPGPHHERHLDSPLSPRSARFVGETGEFNRYLLRRYHYDENDECTISHVKYRRIRRKPRVIADVERMKNEPPTVFMLADDSASLTAEPRVEDHVLAQARYDGSQMFTEEQSFRLLGLYFRFVNPYFPILLRSELFVDGLLSREAIDALPLSLITALYATALPYIPYDDLLAPTLAHTPDPSTQLYRIAWLAFTQELHAPRCSTLQTALLLLQRAPTNRSATDTPWKNSLVGSTVSLAHTLGLSRDPSMWDSIPAWERAHRKRLWHAVFIMDKWCSLTSGTPSHIRAEDFDVPPVWPSDSEHDDDNNNPPQQPPQHQQPPPPPPPLDDDPAAAESHFRLLTDLSAIVADILDTYYTVRAAQRTATNLNLTIDLGRGLRARLDAWSAALPASVFARLGGNGNASLYLAYLVANITLFRALLRPLDSRGTGVGVGGDDAAAAAAAAAVVAMEQEQGGAVRAGARECAKEVVVFAESLDGGVMEGFWHSWSRANFSIAAAFLTQLLLTAETDGEGAEMTNLLARWRWAMRMSDGGGGGGGVETGSGYEE